MSGHLTQIKISYHCTSWLGPIDSKSSINFQSKGITLKRQYFEIENFIEITLLAIAMFTPFVWVKSVDIRQAKSKFYILQYFCPKNGIEDGNYYMVARNIVAIGICVAWLEFIFIFGRLPLKGFKSLYYNPLLKLNYFRRKFQHNVPKCF